MNQILLTEKLYVTPELKRKKKFYKAYFFMSIFLVCLLFSYYIYAEYDRNKSEEVSKSILAQAQMGEDHTTASEDSVIRVFLDNPDQAAEVTTTSGEDENVPTANKGALKEKKTMTAASGDTYETIAVINIPKINVNYPVLSKTTDELLKLSPTKFWGPEPNEVGNFCIVGHNYRNKKFFSKVPDLENGDIIEITDTSGRTLTYKVYDKYVVDDTDVHCTSQLTDGKKEVTLITCTNDSKRRVVVKTTAI